MNRRVFGKTSILGSLFPFTLLKGADSPDATRLNNIFVHHVYFWLKNPDTKEDFDQLVAALKELSKVKSIKSYHIGVPAGTSRDVIDGTYAISWLTIFNSAKDEEKYQKDPIHLEFIKNNQHLWSQVKVYDSIDK
jgi:hypothetical protein